MKRVSGDHWARHAKDEIHGGKLPEHRRCNGGECISCEEMNKMKEKKSKYFWRHLGTLAILVAALAILVAALAILVAALAILVAALAILVAALAILVAALISAIYHFLI
jgi:uncharacterized membrane protein